MDVCSKCGLPKELCACSRIVMEEQVVKVFTLKRRYGKLVTIVKGINFDELDQQAIKEIVKKLKQKLACGGTYDKDEKHIELQGDHKDEAKVILKELGFKVESNDKNKFDRGEGEDN